MNNNYNGGSWLQRIPQATRVLLLINIGLWLVCFFSPDFYNLTLRKLGLHYWASTMFNPMQLVSYQFVHGGFMHLFFNMFALYTFGSLLERVWGMWRYLIFYFICGIGAGLVQELIWSVSWEQEYISAVISENGLAGNVAQLIRNEIAAGVPERMANVAMFQNYLLTVGASGAIFGLLVGFAFVFPNMPMYIFFIPIPVKAKYVVIGYGVIELIFGASGTLSSVAHYAHLGGMLFALIIIFIWYKRGTLHGKLY